MWCFRPIVLLLVVGVFVHAADPVRDLIEAETAEDASWEDGAILTGTPAFLSGTRSGVVLWDPALVGPSSRHLCEPHSADELVSLSNADLASVPVVINDDLPRVRKFLTEYCSIRPGAGLVAVGRGRNTLVVAERFFVSREIPTCRNLSSYALNMSILPALDQPPLFYYTDVGVSEGPNGWRSAASLEAEPTRALVDLVSRNVQFAEDFRIRAFPIGLGDLDAVVVLERIRISPDDVLLPNEMVLWRRGDRLEAAWSEQVDLDARSGHVSFTGALDFNGDQLTDFLVAGNRGDCFYRVLFEANGADFTSVILPDRACGCHDNP